MNTAGLSYLGAKAKPIAEAIARWCEREGVGYEFLPVRGSHPSVRLSLNRQTRKVFFSGSASDQRTIENVLQNVRKEARLLGWEPRKEKPMEVVAKSLADLPKVVEKSEPSQSVVRHYDPPKPDIPRPPPEWVGKQIIGGHHPYALAKAIERRNEWTWEQNEAGRSHHEIYDDLIRVGWIIKSAANIQATISVMRQRKGISKPRAADTASPTRQEPERVEIQAHDPLVLAIAEAIAPMVRDQLAKQRQDLALLKAKADKWDAIAGLVKDA